MLKQTNSKPQQLRSKTSKLNKISKRKLSKKVTKMKKMRKSTAFQPTKPLRDDPSSFFSNLIGGVTNQSGNPLFAAGVGLSALGVAVQIFRKAALQGVVQLERHMTTSLEIPSKDRSYHWVLNWCTAQTKGKSQHVGVETRVLHQGNGVHQTTFDFVPSPGRHFIWYKRNLVQIVREREKMTDLQTGNPFETVKLTLFGRNRAIFQDILQEAEQAALQKEEGRVVIYMPMMTDWRPFGRPRPKRPIDSVILDEGIAEFLQTDIKEFQRAGKWYKDKGIPHRRGYLLYGPPGSGKTSFIQALAGELGYSICVLSLNDRGLSDDRLLHLMTDIPPRSLLLLEDIDAVFNQRESSYSVTFSGLLNALDGVTSIDERLVFMTTNHLEKLDPALIRPGRVDAKVYIGDSTPFQQRKMFKGFFPDVTDCPFDIPADSVTPPTPTAQVISGIEDSSVPIPNALNNDAGMMNTTTTTIKKKKTQEELDEEYRRELELEQKPLVEYMRTDNSELLTEGAINRAKEVVEIEEIEVDGEYNDDGTTRRLSWDTVVKRVNPEIFDAVNQGKTMNAGLLSGKRAADAFEKMTQISKDVALQNLDDPNADPEQVAKQRNEQLEHVKMGLERELQDIDNPLQVEINLRQAFLDVVNLRRAEMGQPLLTHIKELPEEFRAHEKMQKPLSATQKVQLELQQAREDLRWKPIDLNTAPKRTQGDENTIPSSYGKQTPKGVSLTEPATSQQPKQSLTIRYKDQVRAEQNKALHSVLETEKLANEFVRVLSDTPVSMAELQSLMLLYKDRPRMCIQGAKQLVQDKKERLEKLAKEKALVQNNYSLGDSVGGVVPQEQISIVGQVNAPKNINATGNGQPYQSKTIQEQMYSNPNQKADHHQKHVVQQHSRK